MATAADERLHTAEGAIPDPQSLAHVCDHWGRELRRATSPLLSLFSRKIPDAARFSTSLMRLRERRQVAWLSQTMAREAGYGSGLVRFDFQDDALGPVQRYRRAKQRNFSALLTLKANAQCAHRCCQHDACALQRFAAVAATPGRQCLVWRDE